MDNSRRLSRPLSSLPSEILKEALADLKIVESNREYRVDMKWWLTTASESVDDVCCVCLAGAVMANRYGIEASLSAYDFDRATCDKFLFLDQIRQGKFFDALGCLGLDYEDYGLPRELSAPEYHRGPAAWRRRMEYFCTLLDVAGL